ACRSRRATVSRRTASGTLLPPECGSNTHVPLAINCALRVSDVQRRPSHTIRVALSTARTSQPSPASSPANPHPGRPPMNLADRVDAVCSLDDFATLIEGDAWRKQLANLAEKEDATDEIETLRRSISAAKKRLSPEHTCPELQALKERVYAGAEPDAL